MPTKKSILDILKIVDDEVAIEQIKTELLKSSRSSVFETKIHEIYPEIHFGRKFHEVESCNTVYRCLEKVMIDKRSILFFINEYEKSQTVQIFNDYMLVQVYNRVKQLISVFAGLRKDGTQNINTTKAHYSTMKKNLVEAFAEGGKKLPWFHDRVRIETVLANAFKMDQLEKSHAIKLAKQRNSRLAMGNLEVEYEQTRRNVFDMIQKFNTKRLEFEAHVGKTKIKPLSVIMPGFFATQIVGSVRLSETVASNYSHVPDLYKDVMGTVHGDDDGTFVKLTNENDDPGLSTEQVSDLRGLKSNLFYQTGVLKKRPDKPNNEDDDYEYKPQVGVIKMTNFLSTSQYLELVANVKNFYFKYINPNNDKTNIQQSGLINQAKYRDPVLRGYYNKEITYLEEVIQTTTKTHWLRGLGAACCYYSISKNMKVFFNGKIVGRDTLGAMMLGHKTLSTAYQSYNYISVTGLTVAETAKIFQVTDEVLVVTLANQLKELLEKFAESEKNHEQRYQEIEKHSQAQILELESRISFLESNSPKQLPDVFEKYLKDETDEYKTTYWDKLKNHFGDVPLTWENVKFSKLISKHDFGDLRSFVNKSNKKRKIEHN